MQATCGLKALIFGATGGIGSEVVSLLLTSPRWQKVHCVGRRAREEWKTIAQKDKLELELVDMDEYFTQQNTKYQGYDAIFWCLGAEVKVGEETFIKTDKTYPLWGADIAIRNKIPQYFLVSSMKTNPNSWLMYARTKGQAEEELKKKGLSMLSIMKPGLLKNRRQPRLVEKIFSYVPFLPAIQAVQVAQVMKNLAEKQHEESRQVQGVVRIYQNQEMLNLLK